MDRRTLLRHGVSGGLLVLTGCFGASDRIGSNETLEIRNAYNDPVTLDLTIEKKGAGERTVVFDDEVDVPANKTKSLEVLGNNQYYLTVELGDQTQKFGTRPICNRAYTKIIITYDRQISSEIRDCE